jgi:hypothetical protein
MLLGAAVCKYQQVFELNLALQRVDLAIYAPHDLVCEPPSLSFVQVATEAKIMLDLLSLDLVFTD